MRIATGCHKMSSVNHLDVEAKMLNVMEPGNVSHSMTTKEIPKGRMKEKLFIRHYNTPDNSHWRSKQGYQRTEK